MKKYHIVFNSSVYQKLEDIFLHIALESPKIAADILDGMEKHIKSLESMPRRFPTVPEKINYKNYSIHHFFYKKSFRVIYTIYGDTVRILDVRHSARDYVLESDVE